MLSKTFRSTFPDIMRYLLAFFALLCCLEACPPTQAPSGTTAKATSQAGGAQTTTAASTTAKRKREASQIRLTVISNQVYDPLMNDNHLQVFRALVDDYFRSKQMTYNKDLVRESVKNDSGSFAVVYDILGSDCQAVKDFAREAKTSTTFVTAIKLKCGDGNELEVN